MKDISLYGHLTIDTIVDGVKERKTLGSMANVWKALLELDATLDIGLSPIDVGQALIYICLLYTSPSPRDLSTSRMPSSA